MSRGSGRERTARSRTTRSATTPSWPTGQQPISTGTVELLRTPDDPTAVTVVVNGVPSSHCDLAYPERLEFEYMQHMAAVLDLLPPGGLRAVHLGAAGCALARYVHATRPASRQVAVEIDAQLAELVRRWFDLPRSPALRIRVGDARAELERMAPASADVVVRDVFAGDQTPAHVQTTEFAAQVRRVLRPGGVLLANTADRPPLARARAEVATLAQVFGYVALVAEPAQLRGRRYGNLMLIAADGLPVDRVALDRRLRCLAAPARLVDGPELHAFTSGGRPSHDPPVAG